MEEQLLEAPYPELDDLLTLMGKAGERLSEIDACEGSAGNISICFRWPVEPRSRFPLVEQVELPQLVPELAGTTFLITGSGRRLREIIDDPPANLGCLVVDKGGRTGKLYTSYQRRFTHLTSEFNSHLAVHYDQMTTSSTSIPPASHIQKPPTASPSRTGTQPSASSGLTTASPVARSENILVVY